MTYKKSGVNIEIGDKFVDHIKPLAEKTLRKGVISSIGGYGSIFDLKMLNYDNPLIVSSTDGVGTKLKLSLEFDELEKIGIDLVAMCVNDLICVGAEPLFFLDYYATNKLEIKNGKKIIKGISSGCIEANVALIGGETAEMPGLYKKNDFDLAGFSVGVVEKKNKLPRKIVEGDIILGLQSSGFHSNGFSLIRYLIKKNKINVNSKQIQKMLISPTKIYINSLMKIKNETYVKGFAHITGGGLINNIPRILPKGLTAKINLNSWKIPEVYKWFFNQFNFSEEEYLKTFNCGIGMIVVVEEKFSEKVLKILTKSNEKVFKIGYVKSGYKISFENNLSS